MKEITIDGVEYILTPKDREENFTYPMWFKSKGSALVVKFDALSIGTVVVASSATPKDHTSGHFTPHTNTEKWEQVENPENLLDKDALWYWDKEGAARCLGFWDASAGMPFSLDGRRRNNTTWDNYEKVQPEDEPEWAKEARELLKD